MMTTTFKSLLALATTALLLAQQVSASPLISERDESTQAAPAATTDDQVLNFALMLEHLENAFYNQGLGRYNQQAFENAGFPAFARGRYNQLRQHEGTHVQFLTSALGGNAVQPCTYNL